MTKLSVSLPSRTNTVPQIAGMIHAAEAAGFDSVFAWEVYRNPLMQLAAGAVGTERITLATGIAQALTRSPFEVASAASDLDELSGGRTVLGLGTGSPEFLSAFHGLELTVPVRRLRDYIGAVRAGWNYQLGSDAPYDGEWFSIKPPPFNPFGRRSLVRDGIPIFVCGFHPRMIELAGEVGDGLLGAFWPVSYIREVVHPHVALGAQRAGRDPVSIEVASETICSPHPDRAEAKRRARIQVAFYAAHPFTDPIIKNAGLEKEQQLVREAFMTKGPDAVESAVDDKLVEAFTISGTPDECRRQLGDYEGVLPHIVLHTPYAAPLTAAESQDSIDHILATFGSA